MTPHIHMQQEMTDSAWDEQAKLWRITTDKQQYQARFVIMACGPMHDPVYPKINGIEDKPSLFLKMYFFKNCVFKQQKIPFESVIKLH